LRHGGETSWWEKMLGKEASFAHPNEKKDCILV